MAHPTDAFKFKVTLSEKKLDEEPKDKEVGSELVGSERQLNDKKKKKWTNPHRTTF